MFKKNKYTEKQRFSIKKYSFGVTSALVGVFLAAGANVADAQEVVKAEQTTATASQQQLTQAKTEALVQEAKPTLSLDGIKTSVKSTKQAVSKTANRKTTGAKSKANVLPKTSATSNNATLPAGLAAALVASGLVVAKRRKETKYYQGGN